MTCSEGPIKPKIKIERGIMITIPYDVLHEHKIKIDDVKRVIVNGYVAPFHKDVKDLDIYIFVPNAFIKSNMKILIETTTNTTVEINITLEDADFALIDASNVTVTVTI